MTLFGGVEQANVIIVGANGGIGLSFVEHLLNDDRVAKIYATYRRSETASRLVAIATQYPQRLTCCQLDVTDEAQIADQVKHIQAQTPEIHLVINCVGVLHTDTMQPEKSLRQIDPNQLTQYFQSNSISAALLAKHLLPLLKHSHRSIFATISAKVGSIGDNHLGGWYGYRASKAALNMLIRTAAIEYSRKSPKTILVLLHPGTTDTELSKPFQRNVPPNKLFSPDRTVSQLLAVLDQVKDDESGQFFSWDGSKLPW